VLDSSGNPVSSDNYDIVGGMTSKFPKFKFTQYGDYVVKVAAKNICGTKYHEFNVRVNKDPEVKLEDLGYICTTKDYIFTED
jgi:threonine dehydrogenase-like Zn-dependent dehydrogenase